MDGEVGLSKSQVLNFVTSNEKLRRFSDKFTNKAKPRPAKVKKKTHEQHQVNFEDMKNMSTKENPIFVNFFSRIFSRFHWLAPVERKKRSHVRKEIQRIYKHSVPRDFKVIMEASLRNTLKNTATKENQNNWVSSS